MARRGVRNVSPHLAKWSICWSNLKLVELIKFENKNLRGFGLSTEHNLRIFTHLMAEERT